MNTPDPLQLAEARCAQQEALVDKAVLEHGACSQHTAAAIKRLISMRSKALYLETKRGAPPPPDDALIR